MADLTPASVRRLVAWAVGPCIPAWTVLLLLAVVSRLSWTTALVSCAVVFFLMAILVFARLADFDRVVRYAEELLVNPEASPPLLETSATAQRLLSALTALRKLWADRRGEADALAKSRQDILDSLPDPFFLLDRRRRVISANAAARALFELERTATGRDLAGVIRDPKVLEAADVALVKFFGPPTETNFAGVWVTGALDASNLPWRLAWVLRGWAEPGLLDGYEVEQLPVASQGSLQMAEGARAYMQRTEGDGSEERIRAMSGADWGLAYTRSLLGVRLDVDGSGDWSMVKTEASPPPLRAGDRLPDFPLHGPDGRPLRAHDLTADSFVALWFTDSRRRPPLPADDVPGLRHFVVSRWDAPHDSGLRPRSLLDVGELFRKRVGCPADTVVLVRPDDHVAAVLPMNGGMSAVRAYLGIIGRG